MSRLPMLFLILPYQMSLDILEGLVQLLPGTECSRVTQYVPYYWLVRTELTSNTQLREQESARVGLILRMGE